MSQAATPCSMAILAMTEHGQDARTTSRETLGCELAAEVVRAWGKLRLRVTGASMMPALWPGDILSVCNDAAQALPGDIVVYKRDGRLVTHRVVEVRRQETGDRGQGLETRNSKLETGNQKQSPIKNHQSPITNDQSPLAIFVTRGDRVRRNDAPVSSHELLGRVTTIERGGRHLAPHWSMANRLASWILCRSELCTQLLLRLGRSGLAGCGKPHQHCHSEEPAGNEESVLA